MKSIILFCLVSFSLCGNSADAQNLDFNYLKITKNTIKTTHQAKYKFKIKKSFKFLGDYHHQPTYGKHQFNVSMAVYSDGEKLIMIHAETHTDGSGGLDYSNLTPTTLRKKKFTTREQCASSDDETELSANPQIKFIRDKGFDLTLPFYLKQYFTTSSDGKAEIVISYGLRIKSCDNLTDDFRKRISKAANKNLKIRKYN